MIEQPKGPEKLKDTASELADLKKEILKNPDKDPDEFLENDPMALKELPAEPEYLDATKQFFISMTECINKNMTTEDLNASWKTLNKDIRTSNPVNIDGKLVGRFAVTSFFEQSDNDIVMKNYSAIINGEKSYDKEAIVKNSTYEGKQALLFETDEKKYDFNIILKHTGETVIIPKDPKKTKEIKLEKEEDFIRFEAFLKEIFPPAYIKFRNDAYEDLQIKDDQKQSNEKKDKKK